jgi:hypothetical protein
MQSTHRSTIIHNYGNFLIYRVSLFEEKKSVRFYNSVGIIHHYIPFSLNVQRIYSVFLVKEPCQYLLLHLNETKKSLSGIITKGIITVNS